MNLRFETLNKPVATSDIEKLLYNGSEEAFQNAFREDLEKVRDKLEGCEILIKIDYENSNASFSGENLSDEQMEVIKDALKQN